MDCKLIGNVFQALEITLAPQEVFYAERGAMIYMDWYRAGCSDEWFWAYGCA